MEPEGIAGSVEQTTRQGSSQGGGENLTTPPTGQPEQPEEGSRGRSKKATVRCEVCGRWYRTLTAEHMRMHGLTGERYRRLFLALRDPTATGSMDQSPQTPVTTVDKLARRITGSVAFLDAISDEVAEHILGMAPLRHQVALAAAQIIQARMAIHADAVGRLARVTRELEQPWRVEQGGPNGQPTPTKDLVLIHAAAHQEIVKAEEMVLKAAKLALDERKAADTNQVPTFTYSGAAETIPIPRDLSPADREGLRALMGNLTKYVDANRKATRAITASPARVVPADGDVVPAQPSQQADGDVVPADLVSPAGPTSPTIPMVTTTAPAKRRRTRKKPPQ